ISHVLVEQGWFDTAFVRQWTNAPFLVRRDNGRLLRWSDLVEGGPNGYVAWSGDEPLRCADSGEYDPPSLPADQPELDVTPSVRLANDDVIVTATVFHLLRELLSDYPPETAAEI